jgi:hypothetical protein
VNRSVPDDLDVHVILDNLSTHKTPLVHRWLLRHPSLPTSCETLLFLVSMS